MIQSFEATLKNGKIVWDPTIKVPKEAKVKVTIVSKKETKKSEERKLAVQQLSGALAHLSQQEKDKMYQELKDLRNEWERIF